MDGDRLRELWQVHIGTGSAATACFDDVVRGYAEPHRRYHDLTHLAVVVETVVDLAEAEPVSDLPAVVAAAFYHDVIYEPRALDNEERSALRAETELTGLGWPAERARRVGDMVRATIGHQTDDPDTAVLLDADLSVLGRDGYHRYVTAVRAEYAEAGVDDATWNVGRADVLRRLLDHDPQYATATGRRRWESAARNHMASELAGLLEKTR